jgi:HPt (histidine-containing phosphotransfer) domain-containing protein
MPAAHAGKVAPPATEAVESRFRADLSLHPLIREYALSLPDRVSQFIAAQTSGDLAKLESLAHQTSGVGGMYGFPGLSDIASLIEEAARERQDQALLKDLVDELVRRIGRGNVDPIPS